MVEKLIHTLTWAAFALATAACGTSPVAAGPGPDAPVPTSEPRNELRYQIDLEPGHDCEREFDLALYENRGIDLIEWDERDG